MAVEARHLNIFSPQLISNRDLVLPNQAKAYPNNNSHQIMSPFATTMPEAAALLPSFQQSLGCNSIQPNTSVVKAADSGLTHNLSAPRKRSRGSMNNNYQLPNTLTAPQKNNSNDFPCFFGDDVSLQIQQHQLEIDCLIAQHTKKMRMELEERQKQSARLLVSAIGEGVAKAMGQKEEQMQRMVKINLFLQEKVKNLYVENQLWRDSAQTNEAAAISLRSNLEHVLAHVSEEQLSGGGVRGGPVEADEAESCCGSSDHGEEEATPRRTLAGEDTAAGGGGRMCRKCGERESCVLLLPCRHLCLCTQCGSALLHNCPVCNSNMNATVHVNMSSSS